MPERKLRICHWCQYAPFVSGMYTCTKDQIRYERLAGLESELIDPREEVPAPWKVDGWLKPNTWKWAASADVFVLHRSIPPKLNAVKKHKGTVFVLHGSAPVMLLNEFQNNSGAFNMNIGNLLDFDKTVALCKNDYEIMRNYDVNERLVYIQDAIDLENYPLEGDKWKYESHPAIISSDTFRLTKLPAHLLWSMPKVVDLIPDARLNIFSVPRIGLTTWRNLLVRSKEQRLSMFVETFIAEGLSDLNPFIRGADIAFLNEIHGRAGRNVPEKYALGIPVVSYRGEYTKYHAVAWDLDSIAETIAKCWDDLEHNRDKIRLDCRKYAEEHFDMKKATEKYIKIYQQVASDKGLI